MVNQIFQAAANVPRIGLGMLLAIVPILNFQVPDSGPEGGEIRITEWMYNTGDDTAGEFVELTNVGDAPVDMTGWVYDDDSANVEQGFNLGAFGVVQPGESVVLTEIDPSQFRSDWNLCPASNVIGPYSNNLGRADEINIFNAEGALVDVLTYGDQAFPGTIRTNGTSGWVSEAGLGVNDITEWSLSIVGDSDGSYLSSTGWIGSPGKSTHGDFSPCPPAGEGEIRITEWMYNTGDGTAGEYVELTNVGGSPVDMTGWVYDDDSADPLVGFSLTAFGSVHPGESVVFTEIDPGQFRSEWNLCPASNVIGPYSNNLGRADQINIFDADGELVDVLTYGDQAFPGSIRTDGNSGWVSEAGLDVDNVLEWTLSTVGDSEGSYTSSAGWVGSPGKSRHGGFDPCGAEPPAGSPTIVAVQSVMVGSIGDPTNPTASLTVDDEEDEPADLTVTVESSNPAVLDAVNVTIEGAGSQRTVSFEPGGRGVATLTFTVTDLDGLSAQATISYGASNQAPDLSGRYHHHISDGSGALDVGDGYALVINDETNTIFLHQLDFSGPPAKTGAFTSEQLGTTNEVDFEGIARSGNTVVITGSHGNNREGQVRVERRTLIAATISGTGAETELTFLGRYNGLREDLLDWDQSNGHGLGANALGFVAAAAPGVLPNAPDGFNIEAAEFAPDGEILYLGFRAPTVEVEGVHHAVIVPVLNIEQLVDGAPGTGPAQFGAPILVDLEGRSIRAIASNDDGDFLISAGATPQNSSWALFAWDGDPDNPPEFNRTLPDEDLLTGGPWEGIATVPHPLTAGAVVRLVADSGDTNFYGTGMTKDLATGYQKSYSQNFSVADPSVVDLTIIGINDFHGRIDNNTVAFAGTIEQLREAAGEANTLFVAAGDNIGASLFASAVAEDQPTIDVLNALEMDASSVGNHEFDRGFADLVDRVIGDPPNALWDYLGANVYESNGTTPALEEYALYTRAGLTVGVIGAVTQETPALVSPGGVAGLVFGDPVVAINRVADQLSDGDLTNGEADVIIVAIHEGARFSETEGSTLEEEVARGGVFADIVLNTSPEVAAIILGHTNGVHAWIGPIPGNPEKTRPITSAGSYGELVSEIVLTIDTDTHEILAHTQRNVPRTNTPAGELIAAYPRVGDVADIVQDALDFANEVGSTEVGEVTADITTAFLGGSYVDGVYTGGVRDDRESESTLGNLVADALLGSLADPDRGGAEIGVVNPGGLRAELLYAPDGVITYAEANSVLPFVNNLWTVTLTGTQFKTMLEQQWQWDSGGNVPSRPYLQLGLSSNASYTFDPGLPEGSRITSIWVDGDPIDPTGEYRIGTFSFLAEGGDNFHIFTEATDVRDSGLIDRDAWIDYIIANSPLSPDFSRRSAIVTGLATSAVAGNTTSFEISELDLTSLGSPQNTSLSVLFDGVTVGTASVTAGAATVQVPVPAGASNGAHQVTLVATPSDTTVRIPLNVGAQDPSVGAFDPSTGQWHLRAPDGSVRTFWFGSPGDTPLVGDWNGDGVDTPGLYRQSSGQAFLLQSIPNNGAAVVADLTFWFGIVGDVPIAGDWDGDGDDTLSIYRPSEGRVYIINTHPSQGGSPLANLSYYFGDPGDKPFAGDFDGDGVDTVGLHRESTGIVYFTNVHKTSVAEFQFYFGSPGDRLVAGDWGVADGIDTPAVFRPSNTTWYFRFSNTQGFADHEFVFGQSHWLPVAGSWTSPG